MIQRLVLASNNAGKLREIEALLAPLAIEVVPQAALGVNEAAEPHPTFLENAIAKARNASRVTGLPALADDSGLCVAALGGQPGVRSARFAEYAEAMHERAEQDRRNNAKLIAALADCADRSARYVCVLVLLRSADDPEPLVASADWEGEIIALPRGANGFGYDPHFLIPRLGLTAAELPAVEKNRISHRALALRSLKTLIA